MRVYVLGGFLGAGKTTLARTLARHLRERGEQVVIITNDQGRSLVDTSLCRQDEAQVREITGGCFCCRYDELEEALLAAAHAGATVTIAEAVGSCTDLIATVVAPLVHRHGSQFDVAPLAVAVDPWRVSEVQSGTFHEDVVYLFQKQIEEADVVLLTRADLRPPDVASYIRAIRAEAAVIAVSGITGEGLDDWLNAAPALGAAPLQLDYDRYANAEARLGWGNARVRLTASQPFNPGALMHEFLSALREAPIAHVKLVSVDPLGGRGALVRRGDIPSVHADNLPEMLCDTRWLLNARAQLPPAELQGLLRAALEHAATPVVVEWEEFACFQPAPPTPRHRYAFRREAASEALCCAAFYDRTDVRTLLGDSFHPGGPELTLQMGRALQLQAGSRILDVACGNGTSLLAILAEWSVSATGIDAAAPAYRDPHLELRRGDAHALPFASAEFDAVLCECALSTFVDQPGALAEMRRVLRPGGRLALSDMVLEGAVSEGLRAWVHSGTCLSRAMTFRAYARALRDAGFYVVKQYAAPEALLELVRRVKRNLVGLALAAASDTIRADASIDVKQVRGLLREAEAAIAAGTINYGVFIAERVA